MKRVSIIFHEFFYSKLIQYIGIRYITFGLQFINSVLIAKYLGVYYFGVYSFLFLVSQYLQYIGMTPSFSLNTILSAKKKNTLLSNKVWHNALLLTVIISVLISLIGIIIVTIEPFLFQKYNFENYWYFIISFFVLSNFNNLYVNLFRTYSSLKEINFNLIITPVLQLVVLFFAKGEKLLPLLLWAIIIGNLLSVICFFYNTPLKHKLYLNKPIISNLVSRGFYLLLYNISFYFILISARTIVSAYYSPENLGYFTFSVNMSNAVFMIVGSLSFVIYPKILNKFSNNNMIENGALMKKIRETYITGCFVITFVAYLIIPFINYFLPSYVESIISFKILLLAQLILNNNFGYSSLLIARKQEKILTLYGVMALILVVTGGIFVSVLNYEFHYIAFMAFLGFMLYCYLVTKKGIGVLTNKPVGLFVPITTMFPFNYLIPIIILCVSIVTPYDLIILPLSFFSFVLLNYIKISDLYYATKNLIFNKNLIEF